MKNDLCIGNIPVQYGDARFKLFTIQYPVCSDLEIEGIPHKHSCYELHIAKTGAYDYHVGDEIIRLTRGQILLIGPGIAHDAAISGLNHYTFNTLLFSLSKTKGQGGFYNYFADSLNEVIGKPFYAAPALSQLLQKLSAAAPPSDIKSLCVLKADAAAFICALFDDINAFSVNSKAAAVENPDAETMLLLETLVANPNYTLRDIAQRIQYSERHTARLIRSLYHLPLSALRKAAVHKQNEEEDRQ